MEKQWHVQLELHSKNHDVFVNAANEIDAIMVARTVVKDYCNVSHIIQVNAMQK